MPWMKGQTGNPGGRPKIRGLVKLRLRKLQLPALRRLKRLLDSRDDRVVMAAVHEVLDRNLGKAAMTITKTVTHKHTPREQSLDQIRARLALLQAELTGNGSNPSTAH